MLAVDPSSKRSGGSLLGDRARIDHDPKDDGILIRSTAAGGRLGGLAAATREAADALAPAFDVVVVETVGVGQSETDVEEVCDTVAVVVQPASGDVLQFLKAGIMEVPDVLVVTKADLGDAARARASRPRPGARRARLERRAGASPSPPSRRPAASTSWSAALDAHRERIDLAARRLRARRLSALREFTAEHGESALRALGGRREAAAPAEPTATRASRSRSSSRPRGGTRVSRRRDRERRRPPQAGPGQQLRSRRGARPPARPPISFLAQVGILVAVFAVASLIAELAGAANLGVALGIGQFFFAIALVVVIVKT